MSAKFCTECGSALAAGARFCEQCGTAVAGAAVAAATVPAPPAPAAPPPVEYQAETQAAPSRPAPKASPWASQRQAEAAEGAGNFVYASVIARFGALLIDAIIFSVAWYVAGGLLMRHLYRWAWEINLAPATLMQLVLGLLYWLYFAGMESSAGQATIGKRLLKLRVVDLQGQRISFGKATGRYFAKILSALPLCLGFLAAAFSKRRQAWHDKLAGCLVIKNG